MVDSEATAGPTEKRAAWAPRFACVRCEPLAGLETCATAGLEACATGAVPRCALPGRRRPRRLSFDTAGTRADGQFQGLGDVAVASPGTVGGCRDRAKE